MGLSKVYHNGCELYQVFEKMLGLPKNVKTFKLSMAHDQIPTIELEFHPENLPVSEYKYTLETELAKFELRRVES